ncbi:PREDICTED: heat shock cognate 70 kDa protein-like [Fragaria vesca subsp. vesca]|uniref:heat shock cognate 70 kDa protein-like n=1 Tax=Fragaria vesca subsp. vesca TaxID=101020 RepID=UPI0002C36BB7|nr:PREDICTED: heat shock cognate 70 kDa protein-like [Fragaria vesca subsp. vesca]
MGGGTLGSILVIGQGVFEVKVPLVTLTLKVKTDNKMVDYCAEQFKRKHNLDVRGISRAITRLKNACDKAEETVIHISVDIKIDCLDQGIDFRATITRAKFEQLNMDFFRKCMEPVKKCLSNACMDASSVDDCCSLVLAGGSSRIPKVQELL